MANAIPKMVNVVNRTTAPLDGMFDGQPVVLVPGYKKGPDGAIEGAGMGGTVAVNPLPYWAAEKIKAQNPIMGTEDPEVANDCDFLVGVEEWGDDISHCEQSDAIERLDREMMDDEAKTGKAIRTRSGNKAKKRRGGRRYSDTRLKNPGGIRADYAD